jgi:hypothetical protein
MRPAIAEEVDLEEACSAFTAAFLRAVGGEPDHEEKGG